MTTAPVPHWAASAVFYEIYPQTFQDSNGDGIGDIPGIISRLDYIASLGANAIWLNPLYLSPMRDAGYDVADFRKVDPRYGTFADLQRLFDEAHRRGMRVLMDFVPGHTSIDHPWFQASAQAARNAQSDWYIWTDSAWNDGGPEWRGRTVHGFSDRNGNYLINFFWSQPALNFGFAEPDPAEPWQLPTTHPDVRKLWDEMRDIMVFWMKAGADGFRVDMAGSITRRDPDGREARRFWAEARADCEAVNPDYFTVAEWSYPRSALDGRGLHADFLHWVPTYENLFRKEPERTPGGPRRPGGASWFDREGKGDLRAFLDDYLDHYEATKTKGCISIPVGNHDLSRISLLRDDDDLAVVFAFLLTMPGVPFIFYGDEIGLQQVNDAPVREGSYPPRAGARVPMAWTERELNRGFSNAASDRLWAPMDTRPGSPSVESQQAAPGSLWHRVRRLIALRRTEPALRATAEFRVLFCEPDRYPFAFLREGNGQKLLIVLNPSGTNQEVILPVRISATLPSLAGNGIRLSAETTTSTRCLVGPVTYGILPVTESDIS